MEKMKDLKDLLKHEVEDLMSAEQQIIDSLPEMIDKANNQQLKTGLQKHLQETEVHKTRLEEVLEMLDQNKEPNEEKGFLAGLFSTEKFCKGMQGLIKEGQKIINADMNPQVVDAAIIACAQKIEHYEICAYGTTRAYASELRFPKISSLLEQTLKEEYAADDLLTSLAMGGLNQKAENKRKTHATNGQSSNGSSKTSNKKSVAGKQSASTRKTSNAKSSKSEATKRRTRTSKSRTKSKAR
jgi:ferritin-like metal-binding protein YciE